ncbi:MAG: hypothetical protein AAGG45_09080 [Pseudomonadota bacterium]
MSIHVAYRPDRRVRDKQFSWDSTTVVVGARLAITFDGSIEEEMRSLDDILYQSDQSPDQYGMRLRDWTEGLPETEHLKPYQGTDALHALAHLHLGPLGSLPNPPPRPAWIYGHVPFYGIASGNEVYYRYEQYPTSLRIDRSDSDKHRIIKPGTYAAPASELPFTPTGLSAVGRFALPSLLPACWRYELRPVAGTVLRYGASVPLYGQSGGAVEVLFERDFDNNGPIANPVVLPIL